MIVPTGDLAGATRGSPWDVIVLGAGPAGSMAARLLALSGASVLLVDRNVFPREKVCGACLNGQSLDVLRSAGLGRLPEQLGGVPLDAFVVGHAGRTARFALPGGFAVSRSRLDQALAQSAVEAGAEFVAGTRGTILGIDRSDPRSEDSTRPVRLSLGNQEVTIGAKVVVAASGLGGIGPSHLPPFQTLISEGSRIGAGCHVNDYPDFYRPGPIFMAVGRSGYVGLARIEGGALNVASAIDRPFLARCGSPGEASARILDEAGFPAISRLGEADWKGTLSLTRRVRPLGADRLFLIGDACGYVEPFTGEGMGWAFLSAQAVVPLVIRGLAGWEPSLVSEWEVLHRSRIGRRQRACRALARLLRHAWMTRAAFELASRVPSAAQGIIERMTRSPAPSPTRPQLT